MNLNVRYIKEVPIPDLGEWSSEEVGDWLHPIHGPLPDHVAVLEEGEDQFLAALWATPEAILVFIEVLADEDPDQRAPMLTIAQAYSVPGWIAKTFRWAPGVGIDDDTLICGDAKLLITRPLKYVKWREDRWRKKIYQTVLEETVELMLLGR